MTDAEIQLTPVTRKRISAYADAVNDHNPIHVDENFARTAGLPSVIAHGPLTVALVLDAMVRIRHTPPAAVTARLTAPVFPDESLTFSPTDAGAELRKDDGTIAVALTVTEP